MGGLVEQVLAFARTSAGAAIRTPQPVRVADLIDRSLETSRAAIERAVITLEKNIPRRIFRARAPQLD